MGWSADRRPARLSGIGHAGTEPVRASVEMEQGDPLALLGSPNDDGGTSSRAGGPPWTMLLPILLARFRLS